MTKRSAERTRGRITVALCDVCPENGDHLPSGEVRAWAHVHTRQTGHAVTTVTTTTRRVQPDSGQMIRGCVEPTLPGL